jgi:hypothetical protein
LGNDCLNVKSGNKSRQAAIDTFVQKDSQAAS